MALDWRVRFLAEIIAREIALLLQCYIEVKHDLKTKPSGRVAIEIRHNGQPSGLLATQATWWAIVVGREMFLLKTDTLRRCVLSGEYSSCFGGDGKASELVLVPLAKIRSLAGQGVVLLPEVPR